MNRWLECIDILHGTSLGETERIFRFVQMKSLGSYMTQPKGLKPLHSDIQGNALKTILTNGCTQWDNN